MREINTMDMVSFKIHPKAIAQIVVAALGEVEGVGLAPQSVLGALGEIFGSTKYSNVVVIRDKDNQFTLEVKVCVRFGLNIPDVARQAQDVIREAIEKTVDIDVKDININVQGIERRTQ
jgi:uncharacterized alkaline shock family protein YloU